MMDYEHQPANHLSFRLARRVIVPDVFPEPALRRFGAARSGSCAIGGQGGALPRGFRPNDSVLDDLGIRSRVGDRRAPDSSDGALYHRGLRGRFDESSRPRSVSRTSAPSCCRAIENRPALLAAAENRHSAGSDRRALADRSCGSDDRRRGNDDARVRARCPTYTVFAGALAAVDAELVRRGCLHDLRTPGSEPRFEKRTPAETPVPSSAPTKSSASCPRRWPMSQAELELSPAELRRRAQTFLTDVVRREDALPLHHDRAKRRVCARLRSPVGDSLHDQLAARSPGGRATRPEPTRSGEVSALTTTFLEHHSSGSTPSRSRPLLVLLSEAARNAQANELLAQVETRARSTAARRLTMQEASWMLWGLAPPLRPVSRPVQRPPASSPSSSSTGSSIRARACRAKSPPLPRRHRLVRRADVLPPRNVRVFAAQR